jgi:imidazolonepropionase-like amidohydrolase
VIEGGTLIDGTGASPRLDTTVIIEGNRVKSVSQVKGSYPENARIIDARGKFVLPGLIDMGGGPSNITFLMVKFR